MIMAMKALMERQNCSTNKYFLSLLTWNQVWADHLPLLKWRGISTHAGVPREYLKPGLAILIAAAVTWVTDCRMAKPNLLT